MLAPEARKIAWRRVAIVAATGVASAYMIVLLQGPHGISALMDQLSRIRDLNEQQQELERDVEEKKRRVDSLQRGQNVEMEMRRFGRTLPDETQYKVKEPDVPAPPEDAAKSGN